MYVKKVLHSNSVKSLSSLDEKSLLFLLYHHLFSVGNGQILISPHHPFLVSQSYLEFFLIVYFCSCFIYFLFCLGIEYRFFLLQFCKNILLLLSLYTVIEKSKKDPFPLHQTSTFVL